LVPYEEEGDNEAEDDNDGGDEVVDLDKVGGQDAETGFGAYCDPDLLHRPVLLSFAVPVHVGPEAVEGAHVAVAVHDMVEEDNRSNPEEVEGMCDMVHEVQVGVDTCVDRGE